MIRKMIGVALIITVAATLLAGCGKDTKTGGTPTAPQSKPAAQQAKTPEAAKPAEPADPTKTKIDKTIKVGNLEYKVEYTRTLKKGKNFAPKESGNIFLIVGVSVKNTSTENFKTQYSTGLFTALFCLRDKDHKPDRGYSVAAGTGDTSGSFDILKDIEAGKTVSGEMQYEVSPKNTSFLLELSGEKDNIKVVDVEIPVVEPK